MAQLMNRCYRLRRRPKGSIGESDLEFLEESVAEVKEHQALVHTLWLSLDPANRIWMSDAGYYMPPVPIDGMMRGIGLGQVVESRRTDMKPGDVVFGLTGWQDYALVDDATNEMPFTVVPSSASLPLTALLGPLGHTGITAYLGVEDIGRPRFGETMVVSAAAGAVGSVAGQIGRVRGARVVGIAGSTDKCRHVIEDLKFDACINHRSVRWREELDAATPNGIDIDFENVGGPVFDHVVQRLNVGGRIVLCGMVSEYGDYASQKSQKRPFDFAHVLASRLHIQSFLVLDHPHRFTEAREYLGGLISDGKLTYRETIIDGLDHARTALNQLLEGSNIGKMLVKVA